MLLLRSCCADMHARHLLYYPFTPFFVVFRHIVQNVTLHTVQQDLDLLASTVTYFASMRPHLGLLANVSTKLEKTAGLFYQLARRHVARASAAASSPTVGFVSSAQQPAPETPQTRMSATQPEPAAASEYDIPLDGDELNNTLNGLPSQFQLESLPDLELQTGHGGLEEAFDWFSWDNQYSSSSTS